MAHLSSVLLSGGVVALFGAVAVGESMGWPWLAKPLERAAAHWLQLAVTIDTGDSIDSSDTSDAGDSGDAVESVDVDIPGKPRGAAGKQLSTTPVRLASARPMRFGLYLVGGLRAQAPRVRVAAPVWSHTKQLLQAHDVAIELRYVDLWRAWRGQPLRVERLHVDTLDLHLDRLADGRAPWCADPSASAAPCPTQPPVGDLPFFGHLQLAAATVTLHDAMAQVDLQAHLSLVDADSPLGSPWDAVRLHTRGQPWLAGQRGPRSSRPDSVLQLGATGRYHRLPVQLELLLGGSLPVAEQPGATQPVVVSLTGTLGTSSWAFDGQLVDVRALTQLAGSVGLRCQSMADEGDVSLPSTGAASTDGDLARRDDGNGCAASVVPAALRQIRPLD